MECPNCGNEIKQLPKKRLKVFCNNTCRSNYWQKAERLEKQGLSAEEIVKKIKKTKREKKEVKLPSPKKQIMEAEKPEKMKGESGIDYAVRLAEWKEKQNNL